jgi:tetratricopeptide (TPR) repeat protein
VLWQQGNLVAALKDLNEALRLDPQNGDFYYKRGQIHARQDRNDLAIEDLINAVSLISSEFGRSVAYAGRASIYHKQGDLDSAIDDYSKAIRLAPDFAYHYDNRGEIYFEKGDYERAVADYSEAIHRDGKNQYFYKDRAEAYRKMGRDQLAESDEARASELRLLVKSVN